MFPHHQPLLKRWEFILQKRADQPALFDADGEILASFADIERESTIWSAKLAAIPSLSARSVVGIQLGNHPAWPAILLAIWRADQIALPLDSSLRSDLTDQILQQVGGSVLILENEIQQIGTARANVVFSSETSLCKVTSGLNAPLNVKGTPRLITFNTAQLLADSDQICQTMGLSAADINYGAIPFSHSYGFSNLLLPLLSSGIPLVVAKDNFPHAMLRGLTQSRATVLPGVPVFYQSLTRLGLALPATVRLCISASAPISRDLANQFFALNQRKIHSFYGASECGGICYDASPEIDLPQGFVGEPLHGVEIEHCPATGRITVKSAAVGQGYFPTGNDDPLADGEFRPADLVEQTGSGYTITGRVSDFVNITGKKLDPQMVESIIERIPGVSRAFVCGVPCERRGELAIAVVETAQVRREEIFSACRRILSPWQVPSDIWLLEKIPQPERGPLHRRELAKKYLARELLAKN